MINSEEAMNTEKEIPKRRTNVNNKATSETRVPDENENNTKEKTRSRGCEQETMMMSGGWGKV